MEKIITILGLIAAIVMPFWNIPLIVKIGQRKSSKDISMAWAIGVFVCMVLMLPSGLRSSDSVFRIFTVTNFLFFSGVVFQTLRHR